MIRWLARAVAAGVYLVLGGVIAVAYLILVAGLVQLFQAAPQVPLALSVVTTMVAIPIALVPPLLTPVRDLELTAVRGLLQIQIPTPVGQVGWDSRLRSATFFAAHLILGLAGVATLLFGIPAAIGLVGWAVGAHVDGLQLSPPDLGWWGIGVAVLIIAVLPALASAGGALMRALAGPLLGPSASEREQIARERERVLAARNRIARDLHDGVGHALAITTMQAAAAQAALGTDEAQVRRALEEIAAVGRAAMADLDHSLAILRDDSGATSTAPLRPLPAILDEPDVRFDGESGHLRTIADADSFESYKILTEALMNARRHGSGDIAVRWRRTEHWLCIEVHNQLDGGAGNAGRGITGMRERAALIGAQLSARPADERFVVTLEVPVSDR